MAKNTTKKGSTKTDVIIDVSKEEAKTEVVKEEAEAIPTTKTLQVLKDEMERSAFEYRNAYNRHNEKKATLKKLKDANKAALTEYNTELCCETYRNWDKEGDVVKTAIRLRYVPHVQKVNFKADDDDVMSVTFSDVPNYRARLTDISSLLGDSKFRSDDWFTAIENIAWLYLKRTHKSLFGNKELTCEVAEAVKSFDFGVGEDPLSDENIAKALQIVFDKILFIDDGQGNNIIRSTANTADGGNFCPAWAYISNAMTYLGSEVGQIVVNGAAHMSMLVTDAMHLALTHGDYKLSVQK